MNDHALSSSGAGRRPLASELRVSARAVVVDHASRILLIRHCDSGQEFHVLPGGRVEHGETAAEAAVREVLEETGLRVSVGELLWVREYLPERHSGNPYHRTQLQQLQLYFKAQLESEAALPATAPDRTQSAVVRHPLSTLSEPALVPLGLQTPLTALGAGQTADAPVYLGDLL
ncbi:NUDIX domain-containing protein [Streptomyces sp. NBC_00963]|uniref:NUDIX domain-containing protein n=1 Tax=Streptomyces sp. NBC_00963 TaxID=2903697 RepID=UPI00386DB0E6|nr:NUDIX domain-containing protein [Streptomyces sp. NBC_00963]